MYLIDCFDHVVKHFELFPPFYKKQTTQTLHTRYKNCKKENMGSGKGATTNTLITATETQIHHHSTIDEIFANLTRWPLSAMSRCLVANRGREANRGLEAPNVKLIYVDHTICHLYNFIRSGRPLVLNFVSRVHEPFQTDLRSFNEMAHRYHLSSHGEWRSAENENTHKKLCFSGNISQMYVYLYI